MSRSQDQEPSLVLEQTGLQILFSFKTRIMGYHIEKNTRKCMIISKFLHNNCMGKSINYVNLVEKNDVCKYT